MATRLNRWILMFLTLGSTSAWGHPGHGAVESGPAHYLTTPSHAFPLAGMLVLVLAGVALLLLARLRRTAHGSRG